MRNQQFGIEIEMTGITRAAAARVIAGHFNSSASHVGGGYDTFTVYDDYDRLWKIMRDTSISPRRKNGSFAGDEYKVELVSPICKYNDITTIQELVRHLRLAGARVNASCGIHIHVDAAPHTVKTLNNIVNIIAAKEELLYTALKVEVDRERYCQKTDTRFLNDLNKRKPRSLDELERIWYNGSTERNIHQACGSRTRAAPRRCLWALFVPFVLTGASLPAPQVTKITSNSFAVGCAAVFTEQIFVQTRRPNEGILYVCRARATKYGRKDARKNRLGFGSRMLTAAQDITA